MDKSQKFFTAIRNLKPDAQYEFSVKPPETEEEFNTLVKWVTGGDEREMSIYAESNPHAELAWILVKAEMDRLQAEYDALDYARARELAYPITKEFIEAYTEKEIGDDSTKWDAYVINYNKVRTENPK